MDYDIQIRQHMNSIRFLMIEKSIDLEIEKLLKINKNDIVETRPLKPSKIYHTELIDYFTMLLGLSRLELVSLYRFDTLYKNL